MRMLFQDYQLEDLGKYLYPWFEQDIEAGRTTESEVLELLELHRVKFTTIDCFASTGVVGGVLIRKYI